MQIRPLDVADLDASRAHGMEAFGRWPAGPPADLPRAMAPGRREWGVHEDGALVARVATLEEQSWWRGVRVPTCGVAGVAVAPEHRGAGHLEPLLRTALHEARERGDLVSTLFGTAPGIYRSFGWEVVTSLDTVEVPTAELAGLRRPPGVRLRRARPDDQGAIDATYDAWAAAQDGPLTRRGPRFTRAWEVSDQPDVDVAEPDEPGRGTSLALDESGAVVGLTSWDRGVGYGPEAVLEVRDLLAVSGEAYAALWALLATWAPVLGRVRVQTSGADPARLSLRTATWAVVGRHPYSYRVVDLPGLVAATLGPLAGGGSATVGLQVHGDRLGLVDGSYRLVVDPSGAACEPGSVGADAVSLHSRGLSLLCAGAQSCANLRLLGLLAGPREHDVVLDALFGGRQLHVRDYF